MHLHLCTNVYSSIILTCFRLTASRLDPSTPLEEPVSLITRELQVVKVVAAVNPQPIPTTQKWKVWLARWVKGWMGGLLCSVVWGSPFCGNSCRGGPAPPCHPAPLATHQFDWRLEWSLTKALRAGEGRVQGLQVCCNSSKFFAVGMWWNLHFLFEVFMKLSCQNYREHV